MQLPQAYCPVAGTAAPLATCDEGETVWVTSARGRGPGANDRPFGASAMMSANACAHTIEHWKAQRAEAAAGRTLRRAQLHLCMVLQSCWDSGRRQAPGCLCTTEAQPSVLIVFHARGLLI